MITEETRSLAELRDDALAEGGTLTVYAGGDLANQQDYTVAGFRQACPEIEINMIVDYSKYHDVRIDRQLAEGRLVPDVTHLQTSFDFDRWKALGVLEPYMPAGFSQVHDMFKDPDGHRCAIGVFAFSYMHGPGGGPATPQNLMAGGPADRLGRGELRVHPGFGSSRGRLHRAGRGEPRSFGDAHVSRARRPGSIEPPPSTGRRSELSR
jgi:hypothetical protein